VDNKCLEQGKGS